MYTYHGTDLFLDASFPLAVHDTANHPSHVLHDHDFSEICIAMSGTALHFTEEHSFRIEAGDAFVIMGHGQHGYAEPEELRMVNVLFDFELLGIPLSDLPKMPGFHALFSIEPRYRNQHGFRSRLRLTAGDMAQVEEMLGLLKKELAERGAAYQFRAKSLLMQLICLLARRYDATEPVESKGVIRLAAVISHIENNFTASLRLDDLAEIAHMSTRTLLRNFREAFGKSPIEYQLGLRISKAKEMLRNTDMQMTGIAHDLGFADSNYFSRQFKKATGESPTNFRMEQATWLV